MFVLERRVADAGMEEWRGIDVGSTHTHTRLINALAATCCHQTKRHRQISVRLTKKGQIKHTASPQWRTMTECLTDYYESHCPETNNGDLDCGGNFINY